MTTRRQGREWALQFLVQADLNPGIDTDKALPVFWQQQWTCKLEEAESRNIKLRSFSKPVADRVAPPTIRKFTEQLVHGVLSNLDSIDQQLEAYANQWPLHRMGSVERNVMRLALYEMCHAREAPYAVVINEAVDLAKYFSNSEAGRFVNGILDQCKREMENN